MHKWHCTDFNKIVDWYRIKDCPFGRFWLLPNGQIYDHDMNWTNCVLFLNFFVEMDSLQRGHVKSSGSPKLSLFLLVYQLRIRKVRTVNSKNILVGTHLLNSFESFIVVSHLSFTVNLNQISLPKKTNDVIYCLFFWTFWRCNDIDFVHFTSFSENICWN